MQPTEETTSYLVPFALAATAAGALALVLITFLLGRRTEHRRIAAALGALGGHHADPVRGARAAADEAVRLDSALAELRTIIDTAPAGIVALDRLDRIVTINSAATRLLDAADRSAEGRLLVELARSAPMQNSPCMRARRRTARPAPWCRSRAASARRTSSSSSKTAPNSAGSKACAPSSSPT
jgi:PAS domain-containing protein